jgi:regulator of cell morphogenesis and NO signaling
MEVSEIVNKQKKELSVREIASQDVRNAEVLKKFGIEICCGGIMSLETACSTLKLDLAEVQNELSKARSDESKYTTVDLDQVDLEGAVDYLYNNHHVPFYRENKLILDLLNRIQSHLKQYPVLKDVNALYLELQNNLINHYWHKENLLFAEIKKGVRSKRNSPDQDSKVLTNIVEEIESMSDCNQKMIGMLKDLRQVTNNFVAPEVACNSFKLLYHKLKGLEENVLQSIRADDQILYPKAVLLLTEMQAKY